MDVEMYRNTFANKARYAPWNDYSWGEGDSYFLADPVVAHLPGVKGAVANEAAKGAAIASAILSGHRDTGNARITLESAGGPDWLAILEDPDQPGEHEGLKALAIEGQTQALSTAFGTPTVREPRIRRDSRGRYMSRRNRDGRGRFTGGGD